MPIRSKEQKAQSTDSKRSSFGVGIYLDYAASTPISPRALAAMQPYFAYKFGNPSSLHLVGQEALAVVDRAREVVAQSVGAEFREIIFTGSATEANNLALRGAVKAFGFELLAFSGLSRQKNLTANSYKLKPRIIVSAIEHESVLETARDLEKEGIEVVSLSVNRDGFINLGEFEKALNEHTVLVSIMYANNEIGTIQSISEMAKLVRERRKGKAFPFFHTDAAQAFQFLDCNVDLLGVDLMTLSAQKIYGPKGVGVLYRRLRKEGEYLTPQITGGGQEFSLRSGTENVPAIVGLAAAVKEVLQARKKEAARIRELKAKFWEGLKKICPDARINGIEDARSAASSPHILNVYFPAHRTADLLVRFDREGVAVSAGSACSMRSVEPSYVIQALGFSKERATQSLRFSFGRPTTNKEIQQALRAAGKIFSAQTPSP